MECWTEARALKPSRRGEATAAKLVKPVVCEELMCLNGVSPAENFYVESFLHFSDDDDDDGLGEGLVHVSEEEDEYQEGQEAVSVSSVSSSSQEQAEDENSFGFQPLCSDSFLAGQLPLPIDDIAELEWVSHFVDDCSLPEPEVPRSSQRRKLCFSFMVPVKPRSKRGRRNGKLTWPGGSLPTAYVISGRKGKKREESKGGEFQQQRCSHCGAGNTPQWRNGPLGAKTLCNACGIRYKTGRLCAEYRPVASPTFSSELHSNNHRWVMELRKRRELGESESNWPHHRSTGRE